jgi:transcription antitermination factor NusG
MREIKHTRPWFAVQVRSSREKRTSAILESQGYECLLPLAKSRRRWSDRVKVSAVPVFPGYLFCRLDPFNRLPVLMTPGVIQIVGIGKTPVPVDEHEIAAIERVEKSGLSPQPWFFGQVGRTVRIEYGPLRGLTGIIVEVRSECKLVLSVTLLKRAMAVEVDPCWLSDPQPTNQSAIPTGASGLERGGVSHALQESYYL